ncbi:hypothetical protein AQUCO_01900120v1 [Aquilegia coerulea]|uniref:Defensin-like protein n=1 Tax=Aquilegia coerulea TaxID=218851 RepID=A0A2G5DJ08_AQUCA|nr:hypothetical protein AQUCO_01900120v1 [Aquilegia coerulea]
MVAYKLIFVVAVLVLVASGLPSMNAKVLGCLRKVACTSDFGCETNCLGCEGKCTDGLCSCVPKLGPASANTLLVHHVGAPCTDSSVCNSECISGYGVCINGHCNCQP